MTCQDVPRALDAQLTGTLDRASVEALDEHLATCEACRAEVAVARRMQAELRLLGAEGPSPRAWDRVAARLEADPEFQRRAGDALAEVQARRGFDWRWAGLAAALVLVVAGSLFVMRQSLGPAPAPVAATAPALADSPAADPMATIEGELDLAAKHYENAIAGLEKVAAESETPLDPTLMATVKENLDVIDQAIDDSRQALRADPQSQLAQESLFDAFRRKVALLQDTIALMNEMRKGNPSRATAIASSLNKG